MKCACCGEECKAVIEDHGIGPYEFQGAKGVDRKQVLVSDCCGDAVLDDNGAECDVEVLDDREDALIEDYDDWRNDR